MRACLWLLTLALVSSCAGVDQGATEASPGAPGPLILISLDGFRWDYPELHGAPTIQRLAREGARADGLIPIFPSKTFPNHYTVATGLYAENHGIVGNNMWDPVWDARFSLGNRPAVEDGRWWEGEPIWVTAEKQGVRTATYFWPGTEAEIGGVRPSTWKRFDNDIPGNDRVDEVLRWLDRPDASRPGLVTLYFSDTDSAGHRFGPGSDETRNAVARVDGYIARLLAGLEERGLADTSHIVITSDHGMTSMDPERVIVLEDYIDLDEVRVVDLSVVAMLRPAPGEHEAVLASLRDAHPELEVRERSEVPERFHYRDHRRITDIVAWSKPGWYIYATHAEREARRSRFSLGMHGADPAERTLHGIFVARGPALRAGSTLPAIESVHLYELFTRLLGLEPAPNDGDPGVTAGLFR